MTKRKILISEPAQRDIRQIVHYIRLDKPVAAEKFKTLLKIRIRSLVLFSQRGRHVPELRGTLMADYLEILLNPCRIVYKIIGREVRIVRVLHAKKVFRL